MIQKNEMESIKNISNEKINEALDILEISVKDLYEYMKEILQTEDVEIYTSDFNTFIIEFTNIDETLDCIFDYRQPLHISKQKRDDEDILFNIKDNTKYFYGELKNGKDIKTLKVEAVLRGLFKNENSVLEKTDKFIRELSNADKQLESEPSIEFIYCKTIEPINILQRQQQKSDT